MRIHRLRLTNIRGVTEREILFADTGVTVVEGDNEVGKTTIIDALDLLLTLPDSSGDTRIRAAQPVHRDVGPEVEVDLSSGPYRITYRKRWLKQRKTELTVHAPRPEQLTGRQAHDRVQAIVDETLDAELFRALRVVQGSALTQPTMTSRWLSAALDRAAGGAVSGDGQDELDSLWRRVEQERSRYVTTNGTPRQDRQQRNIAVENARATVAAVEERLAGLEHDTEQVARLQRALADNERVSAEQEAAVAALEEDRGRARSLVGELEQVTERRSAAQLRHDVARQRLDELERREARVLEQRAKVSGLAEQVVTKESERDRLREVYEGRADERQAARERLRLAEQQREQALQDREHWSRVVELDGLERRLREVAIARARAAEARRAIDSLLVDAEVLAELERAHEEHVAARAASVAAAPTVSVDAAIEVRAVVDGRDVRLNAGDTMEERIGDRFEMDLPGVAKVAVQAGAEARSRDDRAAEAAEQLRALCERAGVGNIEEARRVAAERTEALRRLEHNEEAVRRLLHDDDLHLLEDRADHLRQQVAAFVGERASELALPDDEDTARQVAQRAEAEVLSCRQQVEDLDVTLEMARELLDAAERSLVELNVLHAEAVEHLTRLEEDLARSADERAEAESAVEQHLTELAALDARAQDLHEQVAALQPDVLESRLHNAQAALERARRERSELHEELQRLQLRLELAGEQGVAHELDVARTELTRLEGEHQRVEAQAAAAVLLYERLAEHRARARQRYVAPLQQRLEGLATIVFGPTCSVQVRDDLQIASRTLEGVTVPFDQLSAGAREQLGILSRLACAALVAPDGGVPVILDDALGWTDPGRLERMAAALSVAGRETQVIVLTCTPGRYAGIGDANVVRLS